MVTSGTAKAQLSVTDILIRGTLSGALLGVATTLAFTANLQTQKPIVGALIFPVGFVIIVLLGLGLVTGNFALVPLSRLHGSATGPQVLNNLSWAFIGNQAYTKGTRMVKTCVGTDFCRFGVQNSISAGIELETAP